MLRRIKQASDITYGFLITISHKLSKKCSPPLSGIVGVGAVSTPRSRIDTDWRHSEPDLRFKNGFHKFYIGTIIANKQVDMGLVSAKLILGAKMTKDDKIQFLVEKIRIYFTYLPTDRLDSEIDRILSEIGAE